MVGFSRFVNTVVCTLAGDDTRIGGPAVRLWVGTGRDRLESAVLEPSSGPHQAMPQGPTEPILPPIRGACSGRYRPRGRTGKGPRQGAKLLTGRIIDALRQRGPRREGSPPGIARNPQVAGS